MKSMAVSVLSIWSKEYVSPWLQFMLFKKVTAYLEQECIV
jgi:hypothetical protein